MPQVILLDESDDENSGFNKDDEVQFLFSTETVPSVASKAQRNLTDPNGNVKCDICSSLIHESQYADHSMAHQVTSRGVSMMPCAKKAKVDKISACGTGKVRVLKHNTFVLPNFIPKDKQAALWTNLDQNILQKSPDYNGTLDTPYVELHNSHKCQANKITEIQLQLFDIGERALQHITECTAERPWPRNIHLNSCSTTSYNGKGDPPLVMHVDWSELGRGGLGGWVVVLSLGASAEFCFSESSPPSDETPDDWEKVVVHSGDVLVIEGSRIYHGISRIFGPTPPYWTLEHSKRIAIQMRDHRADTPGWCDQGLMDQPKYGYSVCGGSNVGDEVSKEDNSAKRNATKGLKSKCRNERE